MPDCQVGGGVNPNLNNYNYNYNFKYNNNNNIISLASPEIAVISNFQSNNMIAVGQPGQPFPTFQQFGSNQCFCSQASPLDSELTRADSISKVMLPNGFLDEPTIIQALQLQPGIYSVVSNNCIVRHTSSPISHQLHPQIQPATSSAGSPISWICTIHRLRYQNHSNKWKPSMLLPGMKFCHDVPIASFPPQITQTPPSFGLFTQLNGQTILPEGPSSNSAQAPGTFQSPFQLRPVQPFITISQVIPP